MGESERVQGAKVAELVRVCAALEEENARLSFEADTLRSEVESLKAELLRLPSQNRFAILEQKYLACKRQLGVASRAIYDYRETLEEERVALDKERETLEEERVALEEERKLRIGEQIKVAQSQRDDPPRAKVKRARKTRKDKGRKRKSVGIRRSMIFARDNHTCIYCGRSSVTDGVVLQVDHVIPISKGGTNEAANLVTSCMACNLAKNAKLVDADQILAVVRERNFNAGIPDDRDMIG